MTSKIAKCKSGIGRLKCVRELAPLKLSMMQKLSYNIDKSRKKINRKEAVPVTLPGTSKWSMTPFYLRIPKEPYYEGHSVARRYYEISLLVLQRLIDLGHFKDRSLPIDLADICNTGHVNMKLSDNYYGIILTDEGSNCFKAKINIEVQKVSSESCIAAIERNGGSILSRYYDFQSLQAIINPKKWFESGKPVPLCGLPPLSVLDYYIDPFNRGYLSNPNDIDDAKYALAQKFGYEHINLDLEANPRKDPRQIFYGLEPGWLVNLSKRKIYKPTNPKHVEYYKS
ncbi:hypothetical protein GJ496_007092 [Pomphorhynchus laevis]|nr:hypothetical protein GJ496_007092 [Pomphorhynchus laevis]